MSANYFTSIPTGSQATAALFNGPLGQLDQAVTNLTGNVAVAGLVDMRLKEWTEAEAYELTSITRDSDDVVTSATAKWPDGSGGTFTATIVNSTWLGIDAYTITHAVSGKTITQPAVTRNASGAVTTKPAITVS